MAEVIPKTMFAWRKHRGNPEPVWEEVPVPNAPPTGILVKLLASGVCRSDHSLLTLEKQASWFQDKWIMGHEGCGRIIRFGDKVKESDTNLGVGDVVALHAVPGCGAADCTECSRDLPQICERGHHSGIGQDGFYAPFGTMDIRGAARVPEGVTPSQAAVAVDAVNTAYHAVTRRGEVKPHETVFLFGLGGLGFNALQIVRSIGARIIVSDIRQELLDAAVEIGVPREDIVPVEKSPVEFVQERGLLVDAVLDFVGTHQTFDDAQEIVRRGGRLLCVGSLDTDNTIRMKTGTRKRLSYIFSYGGQLQDLNEVLELIAKGDITPRVEEGKLEDFPRVLRELGEGKIKGRVALVHE